MKTKLVVFLVSILLLTVNVTSYAGAVEIILQPGDSGNLSDF